MNYKFPIGSRGYDLENLPYEKFVEKYYPEIKPEWNEQMINHVDLAFDKNRHEEFLKLWTFKAPFFSFERMYNFYDNLKHDTRFDDDIKRFMAFMAGDGYFERIGKPDFETWIRAQNFDWPFKEDDGNPKVRGLLEHAEIKNGMNAIRYKLLCSTWWKG